MMIAGAIDTVSRTALLAVLMRLEGYDMRCMISLYNTN